MFRQGLADRLVQAVRDSEHFPPHQKFHYYS